MAKWNTGAKNGMWRGGRALASNGYILIRVGVSHHLADCRGYAYEHRLVAEKITGRKLFENEVVHHKDGNKQNNQPENLEVFSSIAEHSLEHRKRKDLRMPDEENPVRMCACGCGEQFKKYDESRRPRMIVSGHNSRLSPARDAIYQCLCCEPMHRAKIAGVTGLSLQSVTAGLSRMKKSGIVSSDGLGVWRLVSANKD